MQYIQGQSLAELLDGRPLDSRRAAAYLEPVARAVHEAHTSGILHRDLKPHNVLIESKTDRPLVADFGLAKLAEGNDELTRAGEAVGTPSYMSPEQAQDASQVTALTDVYALGATLYAALTGRPPFQAASSIETLRQVIDEDPVPPSHLNQAIGRDIETICMKCLDKSPERRYPSSQHLAEDLGRYLRYEPILARPVGRINRSLRWCRRNPLSALLSGLALIFLFLTLASSFIGYVQTRTALRQAQDNLSEAHQAVEDFFSLVSESDLLNQQGLQPLRKELLQRARSYYERFISQRREDPTTRDELALTHFRIGRITDLIGSHQESLTEYQHAHDIQQQLLKQQPDDAHRMEALANTLNAMGVACVRQGASPAAQQHLNEARRFRELLVDQHASNRTYHRTLANTWMNLGWVASELNELETAQNNYSIAQDIRETLLQGDPDDSQVLRDIGRGCNNQAELASRKGDFDSARHQLNKAIGVFQRVLLQAPDNIQDRYRLAVCYRGHADMTVQLEKDIPSARTRYQKSVELMTILARDNPRVGRYQFELAQLYRNMGYLEFQQTRWGDALAVLHIAQAKLATLISNFPKQASFQHELALVRMDTAEVHFENTDPEEGRRQLQQAIVLLETLSRQFPETAGRYQKDLEEARGFLETETND
jgi:serine/threonine-protein kinase